MRKSSIARFIGVGNEANMTRDSPGAASGDMVPHDHSDNTAGQTNTRVYENIIFLRVYIECYSIGISCYKYYGKRT